MKRVRAFILAMIFAFSTVGLSACANTNNPPVYPPPVGPGTQPEQDKEITGVIFNNATYTYNGLQKTLRASNIPQGVTAIYSNNTGTNVGEYNASVTLSGEGYVTKTLTAKLTIAPAEFKFVEFNDATVAYTGEDISLKVKYAPNGSTVVYTYNGEQADGVKQIGTYEVTANISMANYIDKELTANLTIVKATFGKEYGLKLESDIVDYEEGTSHKLELINSEELPEGTTIKYYYNGEESDNNVGVSEPGEYQVRAVVSNPNYEDQEVTATLTVRTTYEEKYGLVLEDKTYTYYEGVSYKLLLDKSMDLPSGTNVEYYYNGIKDETNAGVTGLGEYRVKVIVKTGKFYYQEFTATLKVVETNYITVGDVVSMSTLSEGNFYTHAESTDNSAQGLIINGVKQTSYNYNGNTTGNLQMLDGDANSVLVKSAGVAFQKDISGTQYYVEAYFDASSNSYAMGNGFAGLLVAHGPKWVYSTSSNETTRLMVAIQGNTVISCVSQGTGVVGGTVYCGSETNIQSNWSEFFTAQELQYMDKSRVKLGVLRYGSNNFAFFVNDRYVGSRNYGNVNVSDGATAQQFGVSGIGVVGEYRNVNGTATALNGTGEKVRDFKYSTDESLINAISARIPAKSIDLYIIAGQSNAAGNARILDNYGEMTSEVRNNLLANDAQAFEGTSAVLYRDKDTTNYDWTLATAGHGEKVSSNKVGASVGVKVNRNGTELGIMSYLKNQKLASDPNVNAYDVTEGRYAGIVKTAVGGTGFDYVRDNPTFLQTSGWWGSPTWISKNNLTDVPNVRNLYNELVNNLVGTVENLQQAGFTTIRIKGMFWMQGERHISTAKENPSTSDWYYNVFKTFVEDLRAELNTKIGGKIGQNLTEMKILIGEVAETFGTGETYMTTKDDFNNKIAQNKCFIKLQQFIAQNIANIETLSTQAYPLNRWDDATNKNVALGSDHYHWNYNQIFQIGKSVGEKLFGY